MRNGFPHPSYATNPAAPDIHIRTAPAGAALVCTLAGNLHRDNEDQVQQALDAALNRRPALLALDLSAVRMFTASGINLLVLTRRTAHTAGIPLVLINPSTSVHHTLAVTGTHLMFPTHRTLDRALRRRGLAAWPRRPAAGGRPRCGSGAGRPMTSSDPAPGAARPGNGETGAPGSSTELAATDIGAVWSRYAAGDHQR
ncbi:STAS domain-containing protein [Kitasatospora sp. NPDC093679]|uniref:STAS domain-containing protein n=1 Tax=Kitasatospora sp. NPDC093679 TaxID=3154983 RepID=UPI003420F3AD